LGNDVRAIVTTGQMRFSYRFGFNGKEMDNEVSGSGNTIAFEARIYDSRLGRFFSTDPWEYKYAWQSSYAYFKNSPISTIDFLGKGGKDDPPKKSETSLKDGLKVANADGSLTDQDVIGQSSVTFRAKGYSDFKK
jgi:RHS repeat-associated protein